MSTIAERVANGAAYLDQREPGWGQKINLDKLDMESPCQCVLGQLATDLQGYWMDTCARFGLIAFSSADDSDLAHGFTRDSQQNDYEDDETWDDLAAEWRRVITERRSQP